MVRYYCSLTISQKGNGLRGLEKETETLNLTRWEYLVTNMGQVQKPRYEMLHFMCTSKYLAFV